MDILEKICAQKKVELSLKKSLFPIEYLKEAPLFSRKTYSLRANLQESSFGIIAEFKRRSPSKAVINQTAYVDQVAKGYEQAGVCGMSVLTDNSFFGGSLDDLVQARAHTKLPLLRKDFMIDPYQLIEAKAYGADVILLIAACLSVDKTKELSSVARDLGLEVLLEVHNAQELASHLNPKVSIVGVNNRNLKTFEVSLETSLKLSDQIPEEFVKISESGISSIEAVQTLKKGGYQGFLMGENFMKTTDPAAAASNFIKQLNNV